tara:strand:- start:101 stop:247 length:147 start_codon:yes stop_codon:yes gene_type:complete
MSRPSQVEASREDRYYEIWTDLVQNGMPVYEADVQAEILLLQEEEERD